jgi:hypothetical protein
MSLRANLPTLVQSLVSVERQIILDAYADAGVSPATIDASTEAAILRRAEAYADALLAWVTTAQVSTNVSTSVNTTHAPSTINVAGTAVAQTNPAPVFGTGTGTGTGTGYLS